MIDVRINFIGMSLDDYSDYVCMYKPYEIYVCRFNRELSIDCSYSEIISGAFHEYINQCEGDTYSIEDFYMYSKQYIKYGKYLVGCKVDRSLSQIKVDLGVENICIELFVYGGGASIVCNGYLFVVHPNEDVHKHSPHVHVNHDGYSVRYSLVTFERYPDDVCSREYIRDEKKIILPFIKKRYSFFMDNWNKAQKGYEMPAVDERGVQYCDEII